MYPNRQMRQRPTPSTLSPIPQGIFVPGRPHYDTFCTLRRTLIAKSAKNPFLHRTPTGGGNVEPFALLGDLVTMDHVNANSLIHNGLSGEKELLAASDFATGYFGAYPVGSKSAERVLMALSNVLGHDRPKELYTERAPELVSAFRDFPGFFMFTGPASSESHRGTALRSHESSM